MYNSLVNTLLFVAKYMGRAKIKQPNTMRKSSAKPARTGGNQVACIFSTVVPSNDYRCKSKLINKLNEQRFHTNSTSLTSCALLVSLIRGLLPLFTVLFHLNFPGLGKQNTDCWFTRINAYGKIKLVILSLALNVIIFIE